MSSKDENIFSKETLMTTEAGKEVLKQGVFHSKGYKQFQHYKEKSEAEFPEFVKRFVTDLYIEIKTIKLHHQHSLHSWKKWVQPNSRWKVQLSIL